MTSYVQKTTWKNLYNQLLSGEVFRGGQAQENATEQVCCPVAIHAVPWDEAVLNMGDTQTLRNRSDVMLGFELDESAEKPVTVEVKVGPYPSHRLPVTPGGFVPAMKGVHCLPTIALAFHEISLSCSDPSQVRILQAFLGDRGRKALAETAGRHGVLLQFDDGYHIIKSGMCQKWVPGDHPRDDSQLYAVPRIDFQSK